MTDLAGDVPVGGTLLTLRDVTKIQELEKNLRFQLSKRGLTAKYHFDDILTREDSMRRLIQWAQDCAQSDNTVMIYGESGTGKELFAQSIHNASARRDCPFVAVNCAALTESLLESELFGYEAGAFTGARKDGRAGLFELAHRGTLFLDEINSMSLSTQAKILRVIEQKEVMRLGSDYIIPLDVRIITAANENLVQMVQRNAFRRDLFFRLNVLEVRIPPLNQRPRDILLPVPPLSRPVPGASRRTPSRSPRRWSRPCWPTSGGEMCGSCATPPSATPCGVTGRTPWRSSSPRAPGRRRTRWSGEDLRVDLKAAEPDGGGAGDPVPAGPGPHQGPDGQGPGH